MRSELQDKSNSSKLSDQKTPFTSDLNKKEGSLLSNLLFFFFFYIPSPCVAVATDCEAGFVGLGFSFW